MTKQDLYNLAFKACRDYEDGFLGVSQCCYLYCEDNNLSEDIAEQMIEVYYSEHEELFNYNPDYKQDSLEGLEVKSWELRKGLLK